jgi:hypothetical protein
MKISRLNIDNYEPSIGLLIKLLHILPNINSRRISPFSMDLTKSECFKGTKYYNLVLNNNNITKLCLRQMDELKVNDFIFMNSWSRVQHLEMTFTKDIKIEMVIQIILEKYTIYIPRLHSLCLCMANAIQHRNNKLYWQWK